MSIRASNWAWGQGLPPSQKVLLLALADQADDDGICWPSMKTLAKKICADPRTAQRNMRELEAAKLVSVEPRHRPDGDSTSNIYRLALTPSPPGKLPPPNNPRQIATTPVTQRPAGGVTPAPPLEPLSRTVSRAAASRAREPAADAATGVKDNQQDQGLPQPPKKLARQSGIVCWTDADQQAAEEVEATYTSPEITAAVAVAKAKMNKRGKPLSPTPGVVENEILLARAAQHAKVQEASGPLAEARRQAAERKRRGADPVARRAELAAMRKAAEELGFGDVQLGCMISV